MKKYLVFITSFLFFPLITDSLSLDMQIKSKSISLQRLYVNCRCTNDWTDGRVKNQAEVELREGASHGPILRNASVKVNGLELVFATDKQIYQGDIGGIEQWQNISIHIKTQDGRTVNGYVAVVFLVRIREPEPFFRIPPSYILPIRWDYSEGSMHTVDLLILKGEEELQSLEVVGNNVNLNFKRLGLPIYRDDTIRLLVLPFWTSNSELHGNLTKNSQAQFLTRASLTVRF